MLRMKLVNFASRRPMLVLIMGALLWSLTCGCGNDRGGDHLPELQGFRVGSLPLGSDAKGIGATEVNVPALGGHLRAYLHLAEQYFICVSEADASDVELQSAQTFLQSRSSSLNSSGLETVLNHALADIKSFYSDKEAFSSRLDLELVRPNERCDLVITKAPQSDFPFNEAKLAMDRLPVLYPGQLKDSLGRTNDVPVAYLSTQDEGSMVLLLQLAIARYLGLADSKETNSFVNPNTRFLGDAAQWHILDKEGRLRLTDDSLALYEFASFYADVLQPEDLASFHHYQDTFGKSDPQVDPLLVAPANAAALPFVELVGNSYLNGVRELGETRVCLSNDAGAILEDAWPAQAFSFVDRDAPQSVINHISQRDPNLNATVVIVEDRCHLIVSLRTSEQFPFTTATHNGLYVEEGAVRLSSNELTDFPVIYLNTTNLELDPRATETEGLKKDARLVLQHEFAHYLGMKHSRSKSSILSPAGYNSGWAIPGEDTKLFDEFVRQYQAKF